MSSNNQQQVSKNDGSQKKDLAPGEKHKTQEATVSFFSFSFPFFSFVFEGFRFVAFVALVGSEGVKGRMGRSTRRGGTWVAFDLVDRRSRSWTCYHEPNGGICTVLGPQARHPVAAFLSLPLSLSLSPHTHSLSRLQHLFPPPISPANHTPHQISTTLKQK